MKSTYETRARLWRYPGDKVSWHFLILPRGLSREIKLVDAGPRRRGFGSLRVVATIGETIWTTSLFPSTQFQCYLLPVKAPVRKKEKLVVGKNVSLKLDINRAW
jgi:hypothetical protein